MTGIFKEYDIRGIYQEELNEDNAYEIGRSIALFFKKRGIVVGIDGRVSSPSLADSLIKGIIDETTNVTDIGLVSTPMLYWAAIKSKSPGVMVTASHNPKEYNGFKIIDSSGKMLYYERGLKKIEEIYEFLEIEEKRKGRINKKDITNDYVNYLFERFKDVDFSKLKVVIDFSNGSGAIPKEIFDKLGIENIKINDEIDGNFPGHAPNPLLKENREKIEEAVKKYRADIGIIFDGDADRVLFIDDEGMFVSSDFIFILLAKEELKKIKGNFYHDLRFSKVAEEEIKTAGGSPIKMRVGNPFYKEALKKDEKGILGYEWSGHIMYKENNCIDDGLFGALKLLSIIVNEGKKLSELIAPFKKYYQSDEINISVKDREEALKQIEERYKNYKIEKIDGISMYGNDFWFNARASMTEPLIRLKIEADTKERLEEVTRELLAIIG